MSRRNDTPNMGGSALEQAPMQIPYIGAAYPDGRIDEATAKTESFSEVNDDCYGLLFPWLVSAIPGAVMYALSVFFISVSASNWSMPIGYRVGLVMGLWIGLGLISFFSYRLGIGAGALISAVTFAVVATAVSIPAEAANAYALLICISLIAIPWSESIGKTSEVAA